MSDVPSNLIPTRVTQLPIAPVADENSLMMIVYQGNNYQIRVGDLLSVAGVPTSRQVIAGTGLTGGGQLAENVTLSVAVGGIGNTQLAATGVAAGTYGDATNIPVFTVDEKGRVQAATTVPAQISGYVPVTRQVIAGTGLTGGGPLNANVTLDANLSDATPLPTNGLGTPGVSTAMSRDDHQHPSVNLQNDAEIDGILGLSHGGTAKSLVPDEGALIWCGADGLYVGPVGAAGQVLLSNGPSEYIWTNQSSLSVGQADNLNGGGANRLVYQSSTDTTAFVPAPTVANTVLYWSGSGLVWGSPPGTGTVTSVALSMPTSDFTVSGSPITTLGTLSAAWKAQNANLMLAGPTSGGAATPGFRALVNDDLPVSGVVADTYGSATMVPVITVNDKGVITSVSESTIIGTLSYQGTWNASTNTPTLVSGVGVAGYYYAVTVAGNTNLDGITDWQVGDWAIFNGTAWQKIDQTNTVSSVNGYTGAVTLTYADVGAPSASGTGATGTWSISINGNAATATTAAAVAHSVTFNSSGSGGASPQTFDGSAAITVSRNTLGAAASGANSDITSMSGVTGAIGTPNYIAFNTSYATTLTAGQLGWDGNNTLGLGMAGGNVVQRIGEDEFYYIKASSAITKGQVVMFTGSVGASGVVTGAPATGITDGTYIMGIAAESMSLNAFGLVQFQGTLRGVDTSTFTDGAILWYNPAVTGGLTATKPSAPNVKVQMAAVIYASNGSSGSILIRVNAGSVLGGTDSNVQFGTLANNDVVRYNFAAGYWENVNQSSLAVGTATNIAGGAANKVVYQSGSGATSFVDAPVSSNTFLKWTGSAFAWDVAGAGSVTSVGLSLPAQFTVSNSPVTGSGTLTAVWASQTANYILAAPNGSSGTPTFRAMVAADVPTLNQNTTGSAGSVANAVTFNSSGGAVPGTTFNGSAAKTVDYSTVGAPSTGGTGATGTWGISISGNAATATSATTAGSATTATTATNLAGGAASQIPYQSGSGTTSFLANGTAGQVLTSAGASAPTWGGINGGTF